MQITNYLMTLDTLIFLNCNQFESILKVLIVHMSKTMDILLTLLNVQELVKSLQSQKLPIKILLFDL